MIAANTRSQPVEQGRREIAFGKTGNDHHDGLAGHVGSLGELDSRSHRSARGNARWNPFQPRQFSGHIECALVADSDHLINHRAIQNIRHKTRSDALYLMGTRLAARQNRRIFRLHCDDFDRVTAGFQYLTNPGDGPARAHSGYKIIDLAIGIIPDFFRGGLAVNIGIGRIFELLRDD